MSIPKLLLLVDAASEAGEDDDDAEYYYDPRFTRYNFVETVAFLPFENAWKSMLVSFITMAYLFTAYDIAFIETKINRAQWVFYVRLFCYAFCALDVAGALLHYKSKKIAALRIHKPRRAYLILIDLITLVPMEMLYELGIDDTHISWWIKMLDCLWIYRILVYFQDLSNTVGLNHWLVALQKYALLYVVLIHTLSCIWFGIGAVEKWTEYPQDFGALAAALDNVNSTFSEYEWYITSIFYLAGSSSAVGLGSLHAITDLERWLGIFASIISYILFTAVFFGALTNIIVEGNKRHAIFWNKLQLIEIDISYTSKRVSKRLNNKVMDFYYKFWHQKGAVSSAKLMLNLPRQMTQEVDVDIYWDAINSSRILRNIKLSQKRTIAKYFRLKTYMPGDLLLRGGELKQTLMYVLQGEIEMLSDEDGESPLVSFAKGTCFGEIGLLCSYPTWFAISAATYCEVQVLEKQQFFQLIKRYPKLGRLIYKIHSKLLNVAIKNARNKRSSETNVDKYTRPLRVLQNSLRELEEKEKRVAPFSWLSDIEKESFFTRADWQSFIPHEKSSKEKILDMYKINSAISMKKDDVCFETHFPWVLYENSNLLMVWNGIVSIVIVISSFMYPYHDGFAKTWPGEIQLIHSFVHIIYFMDLFLLLSTAIQSESELITNRKKIVLTRFQQFGFLCDLIATIPVAEIINYMNIVLGAQMESLVGILRIFKIRRLLATINKLQDGSLWNNTAVRGMKYFLLFSIGAYWLGSYYFALVCPYVSNQDVADDADNCKNVWIARLKNEMNFLTSYFFSLMVVSGTASAEPHPTSIIQMLYLQIFFAAAILMFTYLATDYSAMLVLVSVPISSFKERTFALRRFLDVNTLLSSLRRRVDNYLALQWHNLQGFYIINDFSLYHDAPDEISDAIAIAQHKRYMMKMGLFEDADPKLIDALCLIAKTYVLPPNETLASAGELTRGFCILTDGFCEVTSGHAVDVSVIGPGQCFNESEMIFEIPGFKTVRTLTHCKFLRVDENEYKQVLLQFPKSQELIDALVDEFAPILDPMPKMLVQRDVAFQEKKELTKPSFFVHAKSTKLNVNIDYKQPFNDSMFFSFTRFILQMRTINPDGQFLIWWEGTRCVCAVLSGIVFPPWGYLRLTLSWLVYVGLALDILAVLDLYVRMHVCYYNDKGMLVWHPLYTAKHYFTHSFVVDLIGCLPINYVITGRDASVFLEIVKQNRFLQLYRLTAMISYWEKDVLRDYTFLDCVKYFPFAVVLINVLASLYISTVCYFHTSEDGVLERIEPEPGTWVEKHMQDDTVFSFPISELHYLHIVACYWVTVIAYRVGFSSITNSNNKEMVYCVILLVTHYVVFVYITVQIASAHINSNLNLTRYKERMRHLIQFMSKEKISKPLRTEIIDHYEHVWKKSQGLRSQEMFSKFHLALRQDAAMSLYEQTLSSNPLFNGVEKAFFRRLALEVQEDYYMKGAAMIAIGDIVKKVYLLHQGEVELRDSGLRKTVSLERGSLFGVLGKKQGCRSTMCVQASKPTILLVIPIEVFNDLANEFPRITANLSEYYDEFLYVSSKKVSTQENVNIRDGGLSEKSLFFKFTATIYIIFTICSLLSYMLVLYHATFQDHAIWILVLTYLFDLVIIPRIFMSRNSLHDSGGESFEEIDTNRKLYMTSVTGFWLDIFTLLPLDVLAIAAPPEQRMYALSLLRLTRLPRLWHVVAFFSLQHERLNKNMLLYKIASTITSFTLMGHTTTCLWYIIGCPYSPECTETSWITKSEFCDTAYACSAHYTMTVFTASTVGTVFPHTIAEILFTIALLLLVMFAFAIFIGDMSALVVNYSSTLVTYDYETNILKRHLKNQSVSPSLCMKVLSYVSLLWSRDKGLQCPIFITQTPDYILWRFNKEAYGTHLYSNKLFSACHNDFLRQLLVCLRRYTFFPSNFVAQQGDVDNSLYFVHEGEVEVITVKRNKQQLIDVLQPGDMFGVLQGLNRNLPHKYTYRTSQTSVILALKYEEWEHLLEFFHGTSELLYKRAKSQLKEEQLQNREETKKDV